MVISIFCSSDDSLIRFRLELIKEFILLKYTIYVIAPSFDSKNKLYLEKLGIKTFAISFKRTKIGFFSELYTIYKFYFYLKNNKTDIVLSYTLKPVIYASFAAKIVGIKNINSLITGLGHYFISNNFLDIFVKNIIIKLYKLSLSFNKNIIFQNNDDKNLFLTKKIISNKKNNFHVVNGSGVDINYYKFSKMPHNLSFVLISRLLKEKGVVEYLKACSYLSEKYKNVKFYLGGWIDDHPSGINLEYLNKFNFNKNFKFLGKIDDVRQIFDFSSVVVLPSYREGLPRILTEAMSCGRPIITTNVAGCKETVRDKWNGLIIKEKDYKSLIEAMEKMILNQYDLKKMALNSRIFAESKFDVKLVNSKMNEIILQNV